MSDENTLRLKLTSFQARTLYTMINAREWDEIEEMTLVGRLNKSIEEFLILKCEYTRETIRVEVKKQLTDIDFAEIEAQAMQFVIDNGGSIDAVSVVSGDYDPYN